MTKYIFLHTAQIRINIHFIETAILNIEHWFRLKSYPNTFKTEHIFIIHLVGTFSRLRALITGRVTGRIVC